jgi:hypothetical protein
MDPPPVAIAPTAPSECVIRPLNGPDPMSTQTWAVGERGVAGDSTFKTMQTANGELRIGAVRGRSHNAEVKSS